ncbi:hypothetical protein BJ138DRAFT_1161308 [Hygrophoropsis aurantiaca]|uniref:Uncharacterized protein n=1 Tax=Hygrophoropsis aurantiaca TaxID=72124 RepID=A0ACB8A1C3_9AGAM|nr:hypothetical protein BJ138DRAFT_1161308 [Hygrophoropsis aurantiaca]
MITCSLLSAVTKIHIRRGLSGVLLATPTASHRSSYLRYLPPARTMPLNLKAGEYIITSKLTDSSIGQEHQKDRNGGPKKVVLFPSDSIDSDSCSDYGSDEDEYEGSIAYPKFVLEPKGNNQYILTLGGEPTVAIGRRLYTSPSAETPPEKWVITQHAFHGPYTIETADKSAGWKILDDIHPSGQIAVLPLARLPGYPPRYPSDELFNFTRVEK